MASDFVGCAVLVTLKSPPHAQIRGTVSNILGQRLTLQNVTLLWNGQKFPSYNIDAPGIADLEVSSSQNDLPQHQPPSHQINRAPLLRKSEPQPEPVPTPQPVPTQQPFLDPAIVSFSKGAAKPISLEKSLAAINTNFGSVAGSTASVYSAETAHPSRTAERHDSAVTAVLNEPFSSISMGAAEIADTTAARVNTITPVLAQGNAHEKPVKKKNKQRGRNKGRDENVDNEYHNNLRGNGWRQTAFVEPVRPKFHTGYPTEDHASEGYPTRRKNKNRKSVVEDPSGWATEDATDIQELGDFDFEGNLSKFDKRRIFDEIRNDDTTLEEERLVSFNKKPRPGTNGGKNLHWSENVLESTPNQWNSEAGETETEASEDKFSSGNYSGRDRSKPSGKTVVSKKGNSGIGQSALPTPLVSVSRTAPSSSRNASPLPGMASPLNGVVGTSPGSLRLTTTNRSCPTISPLQMLEVEQLAVTELGLTEDMITENAGRGIAEAAVGRLGSDVAAPAVLVLTGNHRTGGRVIAAARHLKNRGHRVTLCVLGLEHETELLENCRKQLEIYKKIGGRVLRWEELSARLSTPDFGIDLVVDAMFGMHIAFEDLRSDDQATACEMIAWVNRSNVVVISVDIPTGISASTGDVSIVQDSRLCINSHVVVCLAAPKTGIMQALQSGEGSSWQLTVADIGISQVVWRKYGTRRRHGVEFGNRWVVPLRYHLSTA
ncbi:YjeF_N domain protein [Talaromyces proteolyticus]|uniref:Enhancer of mRNA-decapping protein 3 n=1 Tax=Talaromyces proteolyticus TaxID=1131652 RepID=A0AAD4Q6G8_9EURO|nr:YjeF_N domain protein [Talaromyces proteolyticus]KAH8705327.1 YjeF_N domain protein [Talaromyces proteolyticus]